MADNYEFLGNYIDDYRINWNDITYKLYHARGRYFVYLLVKDNEVIYAGRTRNLCMRLYNHKYYFDFDVIYLFEYEKYLDMCQAERQIIKYLKPIENKKGK